MLCRLLFWHNKRKNQINGLLIHSTEVNRMLKFNKTGFGLFNLPQPDVRNSDPKPQSGTAQTLTLPKGIKKLGFTKFRKGKRHRLGNLT